jgi:hypothetical protein
MKTERTFHPETISRQGERNAWLLTGFALVANLALIWRSGSMPVWIGVLTAFLFLSAGLISLSNWSDRQTVLTLKPAGLAFQNGLRRVDLRWDQIEQVHVLSDRWGKQAHVTGESGSFKFRMLSDLKFQGQVRGQMGFVAGETIVKEILDLSGLTRTETTDQGHYYARP